MLTAISSLGALLTTFIRLYLLQKLFKAAYYSLLIAIYLSSMRVLYFGVESAVAAVKDTLPPLPSEIIIVSSWFLPDNTDVFIQSVIAIAFIKLVFVHRMTILRMMGVHAS